MTASSVFAFETTSSRLCVARPDSSVLTFTAVMLMLAEEIEFVIFARMPGLIPRRHADPGLARQGFVGIPVHLDATLGIELEDSGAAAGVHRDATTPGHEADDVVTGQRIAAAAEADEHVFGRPFTRTPWPSRRRQAPSA